MASNIKDLRAKILIVGDSQVGKSSILTKFTDNVFNTHVGPTIGTDYKTKKVTVNDQVVKLEIWDTAGQERFRCITQSFYRGCMGIIIVFDLTHHESFHNVERWLANLKQEAADNVIKILVGNKLDLPRGVKGEDIQQLLAQHNIPYFETSAMTGENINQVFEAMASGIYKKFLTKITDSILDDPVVNTNPERISLAKRDVVAPNKNKKEKEKCCSN